MNNLLIGLLVVGGVIGVMVAYRIITGRREEAKFRAQQKAIDDSLSGIGTMTGYTRNTQRTMHYPKAEKPVARPRTVETSTDKTPDDLMLLSGAYVSNTTTAAPLASTDDDLRKTTLTGAGGTFDGGGSSGDWDRTPSAPAPSCDEPSRSSYDSGSSYSSSSSCDSGSSYSSSSDSSSSSSSSDSGSSSSSSD